MDDTADIQTADTSGSSSTEPLSGGALGALDQGMREAQGKESAAEEALVKKLMGEHATAREFDKPARAAFTKDRRYAAGTSDPRWASDANLIGTFIDILSSFLYAQNPDVSVRPSEKVDMQPDQNATDFAQTAELVIPHLWKLGKLKRAAKKTVRSALTVGQGWYKSLVYSDTPPNPQIEHEELTQQGLMERLQAQKQQLADDPQAGESLEAQRAEIQMTLQGLQAKKEASHKTGQCFDFVRAEDMQISLDVADITDYLDADWVSNDLYVSKCDLRRRFPRLTDDDVKSAATYYQKQPGSKDMSQETAEQLGDQISEGAFTKSAPSGQMGGATPVEFARVTELWDKRDSLIKTFIDGVKKWAVEPYPPPQASSRFYPYFLVALFEVDGLRHPQSLPFRLQKLQQEYSATRSNQRLAKERCIPGIIFNRTQLNEEDARKIADSVSQEMTGIQPTNPDTPLQNMIIQKPTGTYDPEIYDTQPITTDMERVSGVQEALQSAMQNSQPKTATEANIQQTGFASRTGAMRDVVEETLGDTAHYTLECNIQEMKPPQAERIAGKNAFWPYGMDIDDLLTMVEVDIDAGTTGKPDAAADKAAWSQILPLLEQFMQKVRMLQQTDPPLALCYENLVRETLRRIDDRLELSEFIPQQPPPRPPPPPPPPPPEMKINVNLTGALPPQDTQAIMGVEAQAHGLGPQAGGPPGGASPGLPSGGPPGSPNAALAAAQAHQLPGGVPMPPLSIAPHKGAKPPTP